MTAPPPGTRPSLYPAQADPVSLRGMPSWRTSILGWAVAALLLAGLLLIGIVCHGCHSHEEEVRVRDRWGEPRVLPDDIGKV
ncbi:MAG: hypothetical protein RMJ82_09515 [Gemmatales bacterium]|nr:hypothetical protein [Gemmatales bacterium]